MRGFPVAMLCAMLMLTTTGGGAIAQMIAPGITPPLPTPPPPPPPRIEVPAVPKLDAPPRQPQVKRERRGSFGDRVIDCLHRGAGAGLDAADRAAYSRACANQ